MPHACIDVGSNTTRLLVADCTGGMVRELAADRVFTRIGHSLLGGDRIPPEKVAEVAEVVGGQARVAAGLACERTVVVATAAIRTAANRDELVAAIESAAGLRVEVLAGEDEARLAFAGATAPLADREATVAVLDVGGGSTEIAIGSPAAGVGWFRSLAIGSGVLADTHLRSDPPAPAELEALLGHTAARFAGLEVPACERALAVGGSASSLQRLVGGELTRAALRQALATLAEADRAALARRFALDPERARLLPAGVAILVELAARIDPTLEVGSGGLREGVVLALAAEDEARG